MNCSYTSVFTLHSRYLFKNLKYFYRCINMFYFTVHRENKFKLDFVDWVHISACGKTLFCFTGDIINPQSIQYFRRLFLLNFLNFLVCYNESPLKMMKNDFHLILEALFILEIFKFLSWLFGHVEKTPWLER